MDIFLKCLTYMVFLHIHTLGDFEFKCLEAASRLIRSNVLCSESEEYHCLYDCTVSIFIEKCAPKQPYGKGLYAILCGNINAKPCGELFYSPQTFWTNEGERCPYLKSFCKEDGQIIAADGTTAIDTSCKCDFLNGYDYVTKPKDPCACIPSTEDCSCFTKNCQNAVNHGQCKIENKYSCLQTDTKKIGIQRTSLSDTQQQQQRNYTAHNHILKISLALRVPLWINILGVFVLIFAASLFTYVLVLDIEKPKHIDNNYQWELKVEKQKKDIEKALEKRKRTISGNASIDQLDNEREHLWYTRWKCAGGPTVLLDERCLTNFANFQTTNKIREMVKMFENIKKTHIIVLEGISGSGKTQAAHYLCSTVKTKYKIIAKLMVTDKDIFLDSLKTFALKIKLPIRNEKKEEVLTPEELWNAIMRYLDQKHAKRSCLILLDNVGPDISNDYLSFLTTKNEKRDFIITTTNALIKFNLPKHFVIKFTGMETDECVLFLRGNEDIKKEDIKILITRIGKLPMVLNSARQYMKVTEQTVKQYVNSLKHLEPTEVMKDLQKCDKGLIDSQLLPLRQIKIDIQDDETLWEVVKNIPFLCGESIATTVLEACYFHLSKCASKCKRSKINQLIMAFEKFSMLEIEMVETHAFKDVDSFDESESSEKCQIRCLVFHEVTVAVLSSLCTETTEELKHKSRFEMLKMFCYEIDIDARTDITIQRNLLFVSHAKKFLRNFEEKLSSEESPELNFFLAYLHCAIGSTLLFQRTDVEPAHIHLVKARRICLKIVKDESLFTQDKCPFIAQKNNCKLQQKLKVDKKAIEKVAKAMMKIKLDETIIREFIIHNRRSKNDLEAIRLENIPKFDRPNCHYLTKEKYDILVQKKLALSIEHICETICYELLLRTLLNNGRAFNELGYVKNDEDEHLKNACHFEFTTSDKFSELFNQDNFFVCLENDRTGRMLKHFSQPMTKHYIIDNDIKFYEEMIDTPFQYCFNFGILKMSEKANDRHICMCYRILLRLLHRKFTICDDKRDVVSIMQKGRKYAKLLLDKVEEIKTERKYRHFKWISLPLLHLQCAKFYALSSDPDEVVKALGLFRKAAALEASRGVSWSRFMHEGYHGCLFCLHILKRYADANDLLKDIESRFTGADMEDDISKLRNVELNVNAIAF